MEKKISEYSVNKNNYSRTEIFHILIIFATISYYSSNTIDYTFPEMKNKRGTPEYDRDLEEYFQGLASKQGGIGNMASNDQNTIILERLYEKYLEGVPEIFSFSK